MDTSKAKNRDTTVEKTNATTDVSPASETTKTFFHKYKWTLEEISMVTALFVGLIFTFIGYANKQFDLPMFIALLVVVLALLGYLFNIGFGRKKKSRLVATYDTETTELAVSGNGYKSELNHGELRDAVGAFEKKVGVNDTLVIEFKGKDKPSLFIPARLAGRPGLYEILENVLHDTNIAVKNPQVLEFLDKAKKFKK